MFTLQFPFHSKSSDHLERGEEDSFEWGIGGKCDDDVYTMYCKVNVPGFDFHPSHEAKKGDKITVHYSTKKDKYYLKRTDI